jgi:hypothetical protein
MRTAGLLRFLRDIRFSVVLLSVAFSLWALLQNSVINRDGTLYIHVASRVAAGEWREAFALYNWPFYSMLIAGTSALTGLGLEAAAHCLNALSFVVISVTFVSLVKQLGGGRKVLVAAAMIVLLYPGLNENRSAVIRDPGHLGFYLLAILFFLKYQSAPLWRYAIGWGSAMLVATLFRIEGLVFLVIVPWALLVDGSRTFGERLRVYLKVNTVLFATIFGVFLVWLLARDSEVWSSLGGTRLARSEVFLTALQRILFQTLPNKADILATTLLDKFSASYAPTVIAITLGTILACEGLETLTVLNATLVGMAICFRGLFAGKFSRKIWMTCIALNLALLLIIVVVNFHLTGRSSLSLALTLMLAAPYGLVSLYERWAWRGGRSLRSWVLPAVCVWLAISAVDGLVSFGPTKKHIKEAGIWIRENSSDTALLFTEETVVAHYAGRPSGKRVGPYSNQKSVELIKSGEWKKYDILAVRIRRREAQLESMYREALGHDPVKSFSNEAGDRVLVFHLRDEVR